MSFLSQKIHCLKKLYVLKKITNQNLYRTFDLITHVFRNASYFCLDHILYSILSFETKNFIDE